VPQAPPPVREPKYYRLKRHLTELARAQPPGTPLPPERTLATEFATSRTTVRQALAELVVEGRLERHQGRGTFVAKPKVVQVLQLTSYTEDMLSQGLAPTSQVLALDTVKADEVLGTRLAVPTGARVLHLERLRRADGEPMAVESTYLSAARFPGLRRHLARLGSLYAVLDQEYGVRLHRAEETIEAALATPREAGLLEVDTGLPLLLLSRHAFDDGGAPVEWVRSVYRSDRYKFLARLSRPTGTRGGRR